ncbi:hypothetical protein WUBG_09438, partial [Wuchereria bancrofti]
GLLSLPVFALLRVYLREKCGRSTRVGEQERVYSINSTAGSIGISGNEALPSQ